MASARKKALHVGVIREGKFIADRYFPEGGVITVGESEKNTFPLPLSRLPDSHDLFAHKAGKPTLIFSEHMRGKITIGNRDFDLATARKDGIAKGAAGHFELPLEESMRGRVSLAGITFVFHVGTPPLMPKAPQLPREARGTIWNVTDHTFTALLVVSLALHLSFVGVVSRRVLPPEESQMEEIPDRFAKLLVPEKPVEEEKPPQEETPTEEAPSEEAKKDEKKKDEPAKDSAEHKADVQKMVAQKGLVKILGSVGGQGSALSNVLAAGGGFSDDIGAALAGAGGVAIATEAGGPSRKGEGAAQAVGIGGLATTGGGNVRLREKQDVAVHGSVSAEGDAEVDSPTVDKEALGKFIRLRLRSIQGCYEAQLKRNPTLRGKIVLRFTIGTRGQVVEVSIDSDTMGSDGVASCVSRLVKAWRLPFTPDADTQVSFPFLFQPG